MVSILAGSFLEFSEAVLKCPLPSLMLFYAHLAGLQAQPLQTGKLIPGGTRT